MQEQILLTDEQPEVVELLVRYLYKDTVPTFEMAMSTSSNSVSVSDTHSRPPPIFDLPSLEFYPGFDGERMPTDVDAPAWLLAALEDKDDKVSTPEYNNNMRL